MAKEIWAFNNKELDWMTSKVALDPAPLKYSAVIPSFAISAAFNCTSVASKTPLDELYDVHALAVSI